MDDELEASLRDALGELSSALLSARSARGTFPQGPAALALAHAVLDRALPGNGHADRANTELARAARALSRGAVAPTLYDGFAGVGWVAEYLGAQDEGDNAVDEALASLLDRRRWSETYDLISGLVGYGVYALERLPRPSAVALLERIVSHLAAMSEARPDGVSWRTRPAWAPPDHPLARGFNLGLAHGVPGVIAFLARVYRAGIAKREAARLLEGAVAWLLARELPATSPSAFGYTVQRGVSSAGARSAWCYGDPGVAAALLLAARASGDPIWRRAAVRVGARAAERAPATSGVVDAGICHGAAGLAHVFQRLHVGTGDERFRTAGREWLVRALAMRRPGKGMGGYRSHSRSLRNRSALTWQNDASFLTGSAGIALVLASFLPASEEHWGSWDRVLLLSDTPRRPLG